MLFRLYWTRRHTRAELWKLLTCITCVFRVRSTYNRRLFRRKKMEQERRECEKIEMSRGRNEVRKLYCMTQGSVLLTAETKNGNLFSDTQDTLRLWREHCEKVLAGNNIAGGKIPSCHAISQRLRSNFRIFQELGGCEGKILHKIFSVWSTKALMTNLESLTLITTEICAFEQTERVILLSWLVWQCSK